VPWWANLAWCVVFLVLLLRPRLGVPLATVALIPRIVAVASSIGTLWMLSGFGWLAVAAFYAMTALWPALLLMLTRGGAARLAMWMIPLSALEGSGALQALAGMIVSGLLGAPRFDGRSLSAAIFAVAQVFFLLRTARML
jgi:hypothetical protein